MRMKLYNDKATLVLRIFLLKYLFRLFLIIFSIKRFKKHGVDIIAENIYQIITNVKLIYK
jgi:hypothetical protein